MALLGDKRIRHSATMAGAAIFAFIQTAEALGQIPAGVTAQLAIVGKGLAGLYFIFGARRAIGENGLRAPFEEEEIDAA